MEVVRDREATPIEPGFLAELRAWLKLTTVTAAFDPALHPHRPGGSREGGQWAPKGAVWTGPELSPDEGFVQDVARGRLPSDDLDLPGRGISRSQATSLNGMTRDEHERALEARMKDDLADSYVATRVPLDVLDDIVLDDGRMKSQFETQTSRGTLNNNARSSAERKMFGYAHDLPVEERPIYGFITKPGDDQSNVAWYGDAEIEWRDEVKSRTTFTAADSLNVAYVPSPVLAPSALSTSAAPRQRDGGRLIDPAVSPGWGAAYPWQTGSYVEAQIHGGVRVEDIAAVTLPESYREDYEGPEVPASDWAEGFDGEQYRRNRVALAKLREMGVAVEFR